MLVNITRKLFRPRSIASRTIATTMIVNATKAEDVVGKVEDLKFQYFPSRRSVVYSTNGIVTCTEPLAAEAGVRVLKQGGNAADAAVAVAAAMNVTEPSMTGIGGDCFCLFYNAKTKKVHALNGSGRAPAHTSLEGLRKDLSAFGPVRSIPTESVHAVTVPGAAGGWVDAVEKFGSGKLSMEQILKPAIEYAEDGVPVSELSAYNWRQGEALLKKASPNGAEMLKKDANAKDGCRAPGPGEIMKNPTMANTFRLVAKHGKKGFYEGPVAEAIVQVISDLGGHMTLEDLKSHAQRGSEEPEPIKLNYRGQGVNAERGGVNVWEHPPNGQGIVALIALGILEQLEKTGKIRKWTKEDHNSVEHLHACIEALRIAFADGRWWIADPALQNVPVRGLLDPEYLKKRAELFNPDKVSDTVSHGSPAHNHSDTVYFAVTDKDGNGCSFINSNYGGFGTAIVPKGCGFTLQNRGANFVLEEGHPNCYAPGKRPYHTIIPAMITNPDDDSLHAVYGVMGGFMQPQGHVQVLLNSLVFGLNPQAALDAPRFCIGGSYELDDLVLLEEGIAPEVVEGLKKLGHHVQVRTGLERSVFGRGQIIRTHWDEGQLVYTAGSDPRGDGAAMPA
ncbi:gamma-glutamyltransferase [Verruconis gallopava]|uniref:Gamma-glutamyltransferase n=1 Tax=Verruconis gallopava TaxID=253628 RepID=A0A0D1Z3F2_9PEZI|nr:gamma-glutamyltransferase [Verruconis gallopava]KIW07467.1 gamma-glutamyltransferase [Verruconis gallopava]